MQVRPGDGESESGQPGTAADVDHLLALGQLGMARWAMAQLSTCRSQRRGASRGPMRPWLMPVSASTRTNSSARASRGPKTSMAAGGVGGGDRPPQARASTGRRACAGRTTWSRPTSVTAGLSGPPGRAAMSPGRPLVIDPSAASPPECGAAHIGHEGVLSGRGREEVELPEFSAETVRVSRETPPPRL